MIKIATTNLGSELLYPIISQSLREREVLVELYDEHKKYSDDTIFAIGTEIRDINAHQKFLTHRVIVEYQGESNSGKHGSYFDPTQKIFYIFTDPVKIQMQQT